MANERRELFMGLIAPIGIDLDAVMVALTDALKTVSYSTNEIRLTNLIKEYEKWYDLDHKDEIERYDKFIKAGDRICLDSNQKGIFALYGIASLQNYMPRKKDVNLPTQVAHVFRQLKRVEEIDALKEVFGRNILMVACYSSKHDRVNSLVRKMLKSSRGVNKTKLEGQALQIISTDEDERDDPNGQRVMECYPHADFVIDCTSHESLTDSISRLINIYFGSPFISPTVDEYYSYLANAASYRSLDLSRQVGAAIVGHDCEIISMGCNEVPKSGGGTYWAGEKKDYRDYALGFDSNQKVREDMTRDALVRLKEKGWLSPEFERLKPDELVEAAFSKSGEGGPLNRSMLADVIEYGRMVHAEMNALADAARFRRSTVDATLYCTTLPCHMCTKLIIAAGIARVVYIQPYGKSLIEELFGDSVAIDEHPEEKKVIFESMKGVTPNGFKRAFHKNKKRKSSDGIAEKWDPSSSIPIFLSTFPYYQPLEDNALRELKKAVENLSMMHEVKLPILGAEATSPTTAPNTSQ